MRITSNASSIQMLKAQQAWEARRAQAKQPETAAPGPVQTPSIQAPKAVDLDVAATPATSPVSPQWANTVQEVSRIAERAGFIGVSEQDIRRAYTYGESLLADYRV